MAANSEAVREYIASATDSDELTRAAVLRETITIDSREAEPAVVRHRDPIGEGAPSPSRRTVPDDPDELAWRKLEQAAKDLVDLLVRLVRYDYEREQKAHSFLAYYLGQSFGAGDAIRPWVDGAANVFYRLQAQQGDLGLDLKDDDDPWRQLARSLSRPGGTTP